MTLHKTTCTAVIALLTTIASPSMALRAPDVGMPAPQSIERLVVRLGNGDGTVGESIDLKATEEFVHQQILSVQDVDGDDKADLVLLGSKTLRILLGAGDSWWNSSSSS